MNLFNSLGAALLPASAQRKLFLEKDHRAAVLADRAGEFCDLAIEARDMTMARRYAAIEMRVLEYRNNLSKRFPLGVK
jgi:hypothetical protein